MTSALGEHPTYIIMDMAGTADAVLPRAGARYDGELRNTVEARYETFGPKMKNVRLMEGVTPMKNDYFALLRAMSAAELVLRRLQKAFPGVHVTFRYRVETTEKIGADYRGCALRMAFTAGGNLAIQSAEGKQDLTTLAGAWGPFERSL